MLRFKTDAKVDGNSEREGPRLREKGAEETMGKRGKSGGNEGDHRLAFY